MTPPGTRTQPPVYVCTRCGRRTGRLGKFFHTYFGWNWGNARKCWRWP